MDAVDSLNNEPIVPTSIENFFNGLANMLTEHKAMTHTIRLDVNQKMFKAIQDDLHRFISEINGAIIKNLPPTGNSDKLMVLMRHGYTFIVIGHEEIDSFDVIMKKMLD